MAMKRKAQKKPARKPVKKPVKTTAKAHPAARDYVEGRAKLSIDDLVNIADGLTIAFDGKDDVIGIGCAAIAHALKWAKSRGYDVPMREVLDGMP